MRSVSRLFELRAMLWTTDALSQHSTYYRTEGAVRGALASAAMGMIFRRVGYGD